MTSAADFHLVSWRNFLTLAAVVVGAMIPVGIRYVFAREAADAVDEEPHVVLEGVDDAILAQGPPVSPLVKNKQVKQIHPQDDEEEEEDLFGDETDDEEDGDLILEAGPALVIKGKDPEPPLSPVYRRATSSTSSSEVRLL